MVQLLSKAIYNKWYAEVRSISRKFHNLFDELFFPIDLWPKFLIEIFVKPFRLSSHADRLKIAAFFIGNGLSTQDADRLLRFYFRGKMTTQDEKALQKIISVMQYVIRDENCDRYYYYCMRRHIVLYFNGMLRT